MVRLLLLACASSLLATPPVVVGAPAHDPNGVVREAAAHAKLGPGFVTLLAASEGHSEGLLHFLSASAAAHGVLDTVLVLAMDAPLHKLLADRGARTVLALEPAAMRERAMRKRDAVWLMRVQIVSELLESGADVLMSDLDAHWLHDPLPAVRAQLARSAHVVASRASKWPIEQVKKWGAVACMGFVYIKSTNETVSMMRSVAQIMVASEHPDDQLAVNGVLDAMGMAWEEAASGEQPLQFGATKNGLAVALLTEGQVYRSSGLTLAEARAQGVLVYHGGDFLQTAAGEMMKLWVPRGTFDSFDEKKLRDAGLWSLRHDWRAITPAPGGSFAQWVRQINHPDPTQEGQAAAAPALTVFLHVPKAAGTSFSHALMPLFPNCTSSEMCSRRHILASGHRAPVDSCGLWGCQGHLDLTTIEQQLAQHGVPLSSVFLATMLREPVARLMSEWKYANARVRKNEGSLQFLIQPDGSHNALYEKLDRKSMTLLQYTNTKQVPSEFGMINNRQATMLGTRGILPQFLLRSALRGLQLMDFVGLTEDFPASIRLLAHTLRQRNIVASEEQLRELVSVGATTHVNTSGKKKEMFSEAVMSKLHKKNLVDDALYEYARGEFYSRLCKELGECDGPPERLLDQPHAGASGSSSQITASSGGAAVKKEAVKKVAPPKAAPAKAAPVPAAAVGAEKKASAAQQAAAAKPDKQAADDKEAERLVDQPHAGASGSSSQTTASSGGGESSSGGQQDEQVLCSSFGGTDPSFIVDLGLRIVGLLAVAAAFWHSLRRRRRTCLRRCSGRRVVRRVDHGGIGAPE